MTTLPDGGTVLVRSAGPPRLPVDRCVDVRPGPFAAFDGERFWMSLCVCVGDQRRCFERGELAAMEDAVVAALVPGRSCRAGRVWPISADLNGPAALRFGDRAACRRMLPAAAVDAIERRLDGAARRASSPLVTWTTGDPRPDDERTYDAVVDAPERSE